MCTYVYICFAIGFFFLFSTLGTPCANYGVPFPEKVQQCRGLVRTLGSNMLLSPRQSYST